MERKLIIKTLLASDKLYIIRDAFSNGKIER